MELWDPNPLLNQKNTCNLISWSLDKRGGRKLVLGTESSQHFNLKAHLHKLSIMNDGISKTKVEQD